MSSEIYSCLDQLYNNVNSLVALLENEENKDQSTSEANQISTETLQQSAKLISDTTTKCTLDLNIELEINQLDSYVSFYKCDTQIRRMPTICCFVRKIFNSITGF